MRGAPISAGAMGNWLASPLQRGGFGRGVGANGRVDQRRSFGVWGVILPGWRDDPVRVAASNGERRRAVTLPAEAGD